MHRPDYPAPDRTATNRDLRAPEVLGAPGLLDYGAPMGLAMLAMLVLAFLLGYLLHPG